ncbi:MAG TPA: TolC family protein [Verrucomicrobiae bacterium]|nr:TolC family protein [Verrucomicrobiae bacterium]
MKRACVWLAVAGCVGLGVRAARADETQTLTLKAAQEITLRNHPKISEAELEALASKQVVIQARAGFLPNVMFNATAVDAFEANTRIAAGYLNNPSVFDRNAEGLTVSQLLTDFGRTAHLVNSSRLSSRAAAANTEATREEILLQVDVAFFAALKAQSVLDVARQTLETRQLLLDQISALATNKLRSELDLRFAEVTYEEGRLLVAQAQNDLDQAYNALATLLGDREKHGYRLIEQSTPTAKPADPTGLVDTALSQRPDLARLRLERDAASQYALAQKALNYPTVSAFGAGGFIPVRDTAHFDDRYAAAGVNLSLPIFEGGLISAKRSEAELRSQAVGEKLRDAENTVIQDVRNAGLNVNYAYERLDLTQKLFENASQAFDLAQARYKLGSSSIVELSQSQLEKTSAQIANTSAKYEYEIQRAILNFQIGATP